MEREQKPRRPRIGDKSVSRDGNNMNEKYERVDYSNRERAPFDPERKPRQNFDNENRGGYNKPSYGNRSNYTPRPRFNENGNSNNPEQNYNRPDYNRPERNYNRPTFNNGERSYNNSGERSYNNNGERSYNNNNGERNYNRPSFNKPYNNSENGERSYNSNRPYKQPSDRGGYNNRNSSFSRPNNGGGYQQRNRYDNNGGERSFNKPQKRTSDYDPNSKYSIKKRIIYNELNVDPNEPLRLNKYLANAGVCSRREADELILSGAIKVNGEVKNELGTKIHRNDEVVYKDKPIRLEHKIYVLLNKPKDCVTTSDDPQGRLTVMDIVRSACTERIYPVGRLDRNTTGVLLLTNDGDLASKLTHPKFVKKKIYHVWTDKDVTEEDMQKIADGIELEDGPIHADAVSYATDTDKNQVGIEIHSGRNRIVRRIFESLGYRVIKLDRVYFAGLTKKNLPRGRWRYLTQSEVNMLAMGSFE